MPSAGVGRSELQFDCDFGEDFCTVNFNGVIDRFCVVLSISNFV